ncbi:MAG: TolC family protein [Gammaproteobacteria bacterium]
MRAGLTPLLLGLAMPAAFAEPAARQLGFTEAVQMALQQTPEMMLARAKLTEARGGLKEARGHGLPSLTLSEAGMGSDNALNVFGMKLNQRQATFNDFGAGQFTGPASLFVAPDNLNYPGYYRNYQTKLQLDVPIFNGGKILGYVQQAEAYVRAARKGDEMAHQQVILEVLKAYEGVRAAQAFVGVSQKAEQAAQSYVKTTNNLFNRGVVSKSEQLTAQLNLGDTQLKARQAQIQLGNTLTQLRILTGLSSDRPISVEAVMPPPMPQGSLDGVIKTALTNNPGIAALQAQLRAAQAGVTVARADYMPHFNMQLSREWNQETLGGGFHNQSNTVAGVLSWKLLDLGSRGGAYDQAQARRIQAEARLHEMRNKLTLQVDKAWRDAQLADERVQVKSLAVEQAEEAERLERLRYEKGISTLTNLLSAQAQLDKARADLIAAHYQQIMQRAGLQMAMGSLDLKLFAQ